MFWDVNNNKTPQKKNSRSLNWYLTHSFSFLWVLSVNHMYQYAIIFKKFLDSNTVGVQHQQNIENGLVSESFQKKTKENPLFKKFTNILKS